MLPFHALLPLNHEVTYPWLQQHLARFDYCNSIGRSQSIIIFDIGNTGIRSRVLAGLPQEVELENQGIFDDSALIDGQLFLSTLGYNCPCIKANLGSAYRAQLLGQQIDPLFEFGETHLELKQLRLYGVVVIS